MFGQQYTGATSTSPLRDHASFHQLCILSSSFPPHAYFMRTRAGCHRDKDDATALSNTPQVSMAAMIVLTRCANRPGIALINVPERARSAVLRPHPPAEPRASLRALLKILYL